jgi:hypothetical protein
VQGVEQAHREQHGLAGRAGAGGDQFGRPVQPGKVGRTEPVRGELGALRDECARVGWVGLAAVVLAVQQTAAGDQVEPVDGGQSIVQDSRAAATVAASTCSAYSS